MSVKRTDRVASICVGLALVLYMLWLAGVELPGLAGVRALGAVALVLGFVASATAVVPAFDELVHGSKAYVVAMSVIGLVALISGIRLMLDASEVALAVLMGAMVVMWVAATVRHSITPTRTTTVRVKDRDPVRAMSG